MTKTADIADRARNAAKVLRNDEPCWVTDLDGSSSNISAILDEAATKIETLRASLAKMMRER
jgi:hypothetical protein